MLSSNSQGWPQRISDSAAGVARRRSRGSAKLPPGGLMAAPDRAGPEVGPPASGFAPSPDFSFSIQHFTELSSPGHSPGGSWRERERDLTTFSSRIGTTNPIGQFHVAYATRNC